MIILQLALYCALFTLMVKVGVGNNALNGLYFYPKPVQEKVYELVRRDRDRPSVGRSQPVLDHTRHGRNLIRTNLASGPEETRNPDADLDPASIRHILITHQDTDHVGALERDSELLFKDATVYIGEIENRYLTGEVRRKVFHGAYKLPMVKTDNRRTLLRDGEVLQIGDIKIECILVPGHTWGHLVYLIDDEYLLRRNMRIRPLRMTGISRTMIRRSVQETHFSERWQPNETGL